VDAIVGGGAACLCFFTFQPLGDDDGAGIAIDVDDIA